MIRRALSLSVLVAGLCLLLVTSSAAQTEGARIDVLEVEGVIDRSVTGYLRDTVAGAAADEAELVVLELNSPGGLNVTADELIGIVDGSEVPVLAYVPTSGRANGAAAVLGETAHVLAMSPVSRLGAASPVDLADAAVDEAEAEALAIRLAELASERGRDPEFAAATATSGTVVAILAAGATPEDVPAELIPESDDVLAVGAEDAVERGLVDVVEPELNAVLERLSGVEVSTTSGRRTLDIDGETAQLHFHNLGLVDRVLHTVANPTLAYLLVIGGALALAFEVFQPGFGVAGASGLALLALGLYGMAVLPVSWPAAALLGLGLVLLGVDLAIAGLGPLTLAGTLALGAGSLLLFDGPQVLRAPLWVTIPVVLFAVAFFVVIMTTVLRAQGGQAAAGAERLIGQTGIVRSVLNPEGHVFVGGALWRARAPDEAGRLRTGTRVRVRGLDDDLTLDVEPAGEREDSPVGMQ